MDEKAHRKEINIFLLNGASAGTVLDMAKGFQKATFALLKNVMPKDQRKFIKCILLIDCNPLSMLKNMSYFEPNCP